MADKILILGDSGDGKTTSLRNFNPNDLYVHQCTKKRLPWKGSTKQYSLENKNLSIGHTLHSLEKIEGVKPNENFGILSAIRYVSQKTDKKYMAIDDMGYYFSKNFLDRTGENQFEVFKDLAEQFARIIAEIDRSREDLTVFLFGHTQKDQDGKLSLLTVGKFVDEKYKVEGVFETVLLATGGFSGYNFITNGITPAKSPMGMFEGTEVENDLVLITEKIKEYYEGE